MARVGNLLLVCRYADGTYRLYRRVGASFIQLNAQSLPNALDEGNMPPVFAGNGYIYAMTQQGPSGYAGVAYRMNEADLTPTLATTFTSDNQDSYWTMDLIGSAWPKLMVAMNRSAGGAVGQPLRFAEILETGVVTGQSAQSFGFSASQQVAVKGSRNNDRYVALSGTGSPESPLRLVYRRTDNEAWWYSTSAVVWDGAPYSPTVMDWTPDSNYLLVSSGTTGDPTFSLFARAGVNTAQTLTEVYRSPIGPGKVVQIAAQQNFVAIGYEIDDGSISYRTDLYKRFGDTMVKVDQVDGIGKLLAWSLENVLIDASAKKGYSRSGSALTEIVGLLTNVVVGAIQQGVSDHVDLPVASSYMYDGALADLLLGTVALNSLYVMLLDENAAYLSSDSTVSQVTNAGAYEVFGSNWPEGGVNLTTVALAADGVNSVRMTADNVSQDIFGGDISARYALIYSGTIPLIFIDFGIVRTVPNSTEALLDFEIGGIMMIST